MEESKIEETKDSSGEPVGKIAWGIISDEHSTQEDEQMTEELVALLRDKYKLFESQQQSEMREEALAKLYETIKAWI